MEEAVAQGASAAARPPVRAAPNGRARSSLPEPGNAGIDTQVGSRTTIGLDFDAVVGYLTGFDIGSSDRARAAPRTAADALADAGSVIRARGNAWVSLTACFAVGAGADTCAGRLTGPPGAT